MAQAKITINAVAGSNDSLPINTLVQLGNQNTGGETTFTWSILDQPPGSADALSASNIQNPTFTPKKEGTYVLQLVVNQGQASEQTDVQIAAVRQIKHPDMRVPGAGETTQTGAAGWSTAVDAMLRQLDNLRADANVIVGVTGSGGLTAGTVLKVIGTSTIKAGLPGAESVPTLDKALATSRDDMQRGDLYVLVGGVDGSPSPANGAVIAARRAGSYLGVSLTGTVGAPIYVSDAGALSITPGTNPRALGTIVRSGGGTIDVHLGGYGSIYAGVGFVDTMANLVANVRPPAAGSMQIELLGFAAANDGGEGTFVWVPGSTRADDGGTVIASTYAGAPSGRWWRKGAHSHTDVRWFGAKGDNSNVSDGEAIQAAIFAVQQRGGGTVFLPAGTYLCRVAPVIPRTYLGQPVAISIIGEGGGTNSTRTDTLRNGSVLRAASTLAPATAAWAQSTTYVAGDRRRANGREYVCITAGTSSNAGTGPAACSPDITDGTVHWKFVGAYLTGSVAALQWDTVDTVDISGHHLEHFMVLRGDGTDAGGPCIAHPYNPGGVNGAVRIVGGGMKDVYCHGGTFAGNPIYIAGGWAFDMEDVVYSGGDATGAVLIEFSSRMNLRHVRSFAKRATQGGITINGGGTFTIVNPRHEGIDTAGSCIKLTGGVMEVVIDNPSNEGADEDYHINIDDAHRVTVIEPGIGAQKSGSFGVRVGANCSDIKFIGGLGSYNDTGGAKLLKIEAGAKHIDWLEPMVVIAGAALPATSMSIDAAAIDVRIRIREKVTNTNTLIYEFVQNVDAAQYNNDVLLWYSRVDYAQRGLVLAGVGNVTFNQIETAPYDGYQIDVYSAGGMTIRHKTGVDPAGLQVVTLSGADLVLPAASFARFVQWAGFWIEVAHNRGGIVPPLVAVDAVDDTTVSLTDVAMASMTATIVYPGTYEAKFSGTGHNSNATGSVYFSFYKNGVQVTNSERRIQSNNDKSTVLIEILTGLVATDVITVQWHVDGNTGTMHSRNLILTKLS